MNRSSETMGIDREVLNKWGHLFKLSHQRPPRQQNIDAIVISTGDWTDRIQTALDLWKEYADEQENAPVLVPAGLVAKRGWIVGTEVGSQPYNAEWMAKWFKSKGVPENRILAEPTAKNTKEMADFSLAIVKNEGFRNIILTVSPYFLPRAYMTMVSSIISGEWPLQTYLYSYPSKDLPWQGYVPDEPKTRFEQIPVEIDRIHRYQSSGDVATEVQLNQYVHWLRGSHGK